MTIIQFSSVTQSCLTFCDPMDCSIPGFPVHRQLPELAYKLISIELVLDHPTILSFVLPLSSCLQSFPGLGSFPMNQFFASTGQGVGASALASILPMTIQDWFPLGWTVGSCSPRDSQESFPMPQFKSINSSALNFLYSPTLISMHDYWKNHSLG